MTVAVLVTNEEHFWLPYDVEPIGETGWGVLADDDDETWVRVNEWIFGFTTFTIPPAGIVRSVQVATRGYNRTSESPVTMFVNVTDALGAILASFTLPYPYVPLPETTAVDRTTATSAVIADQTLIDAIRVHVRKPVPGYGPDDKVVLTKLSVNVIYAAVPVVVVGDPSGTILTANPVLSWAYSGDVDADGGGVQQRYHVKVFDAATYGAVGFDPATSIAAYDSGEVVSNTTSAIIGPLVNVTTFKAYMRVAQNVNGAPHWSLWDDGPEFTTDTDPPQIATINATISGAAVRVRVTRVVNAAYLTPTVGTVSTPDPGPVPDLVTFVIRSSHQVGSGQAIAAQWPGEPQRSWLWYMSPHAQQLQYSNDGTDATMTLGTLFGSTLPDQTVPHDIAVTVDSSVTPAFARYLRRPVGGTWALQSEAPIADFGSAFDSNGPLDVGGWFDGRIYSAEMRTGTDPDAGTVVWRFDADDYPGTGTSYVDPRGRTWTLTAAAAIHTDNDWTHVDVERSVDAGVSWRPVRGGLAVAAPDDTVVVYDWEHPEGVPLRYRARAQVRDGALVLSQGDWKATTSPITWTTEDCGEWLRAPGDPAGAMFIEVVVDEATTTTRHRIGVLDVIGRESPVTVWDVPLLPTGVLSTVTRSYDDGVALRELVRTAPVLLWQGRRAWGHPHRWMVIVDHSVSRHPSADSMFTEYRQWEISWVEVAEPPVLS